MTVGGIAEGLNHASKNSTYIAGGFAAARFH
jgi:hypothetical protein